MPDLPPDTGVGSGRESTASTPRWVKVLGIIAIIVVLLFVILHFTGRGHGGHAPSSSVTGDRGHKPPASGHR